MSVMGRNRQIIKVSLDQGQPLPPEYKLMPFDDAPQVELVWQGKSSQVTSVAVPFSSIEHVDEPRAGAEGGIHARGRVSHGHPYT
jgi:hypothetical protein